MTRLSAGSSPGAGGAEADRSQRISGLLPHWKGKALSNELVTVTGKASPVRLTSCPSLTPPLHAQVYKKLGQTHLALMNFSWAMDLDPKGANNQIKEAIDKRYLPEDEGETALSLKE